jgi:sugar phosphate permease
VFKTGLFQGLGAPSCAKLLTTWYATKERGTFWGLWNISHNLGGLSAPIITSTVAMAFGWRVRFAFWPSMSFSSDGFLCTMRFSSDGFLYTMRFFVRFLGFGWRVLLPF